MKITVDFEDRDLEDLFFQHMAEQTEYGRVEDWLATLAYEAMWAHPDYRVCPNEECCELLYPIMQSRQVFDDPRKLYRVDIVGPVEECPKCGTKTVKEAERQADPELKAMVAESNRRFVEGRCSTRDRKPLAMPEELNALVMEDLKQLQQ